MEAPAAPLACWIVLCWGRIAAGPVPNGPPWLFLLPAHAELYAAQLRASGIDAATRGWTANVTEWQGNTLIRHPAIPPPAMAQHAPPMLTSAQPEGSAPVAEHVNGASQPAATVLPPPTPSLE